MSVNKHEPHVLILPEDDANRQLANGFLLNESVLTARIQVLPVAGGWLKVLETFCASYASTMDRYPARLMVLLIDFDGNRDRLTGAMAKVPSHLTDRVFILGTLTEPEDLKKANLGSYEAIGSALAKECHEESNAVWGHELLRHNAAEMSRLRRCVMPILFRQNF